MTLRDFRIGWRLLLREPGFSLVTVLGLALGGPGGDVVFDGAGVMAYAVLLLIVGGLLPPAAVLRRHL